MIKGSYKWVKLPDRGPRGTPENYERVRLLATSDGAKLIKGEWYVKVKREVHRDKR
uniref:Uncharacterized protein n=1 Tax=viral metagenome TaxID=1070528 RepID=A0A6M3Y6U9_9ZZZZ